MGLEQLPADEFRTLLKAEAKALDCESLEYPARLMREASARVEYATSARSMHRLLLLTAAAIIAALVWSTPPACPGPLDTKVVPLDPTSIRAAREEVYEL